QSFFSDNVRDTALAIANVEAGKMAADLGAGTGFVTEGLVQAGLKVIAVDQSEAMLAEMKRKFAKVKTIDYRVGESEKLPIEENTLDYVFCNMYLHHVESPKKSIIEMTRVLKSGGKVVITDMDEHVYDFLRKEQHDRWLGFKREDIEQWFVVAGLINIDIDCIGENCCADSVSGAERANVNLFIACGEKP
ncbi:class I SAM-dependent methyltransferase, partial [Acidobacteriota bacterium]